MKRQALGRGLDAILGTEDGPGNGGLPNATRHERPVASPAPSGTALEVPIENVRPGSGQPRRRFDDAALDELAASIKEKGIIQPLVVADTSDGYELVAGERRLRAAERAGLTRVPVVIRERAGDSELLELALVENLQREDLTPLEQAGGFERLIADHGYTQEELAKRVGKSRAAVANTVRLLALPGMIKEALESGMLSEGHARALLGLATAAEQIKAARQVMRKNMSVRQTEDLVKSASTRPARKSASTAAASVDPALELSLTRALGTKVRLRGSTGKGHIEIDYHSVDELTRLAEKLGS